MTLFAVALKCGGFGASGSAGSAARPSCVQERQQGEQAHAAAGAGEEVAAGVGTFVMRSGHERSRRDSPQALTWRQQWSQRAQSTYMNSLRVSAIAREQINRRTGTRSCSAARGRSRPRPASRECRAAVCAARNFAAELDLVGRRRPAPGEAVGPRGQAGVVGRGTAAARSAPSRLARSSAKSPLSSNSACGAVVVTARRAQLLCMSGRSKASNSGITQVPLGEDVDRPAILVLGLGVRLPGVAADAVGQLRPGADAEHARRSARR